MQTANVVDENIKRIGELFPNCLTERLDENGRPEVAVDFDQLRQELSKDIPEVYNILRKGSDAAREVAAQTLHEMKDAMKINYFDDAALIPEQAEKYKA